MNHEEYKEMMAAGALSALDHAERSVLLDHLATCADCWGEMERWRDVAATLALAAPPLAPSAAVRSSILQSIRDDTVGGRPRLEPVRPHVEPPAKSAIVIPLTPRPRQPWTSSQIWGAIAAAVIFVALILGLAVMWQQNRNAKEELARLTRENQEARAALAVISSTQARVTHLAGTIEAPGAQAVLALDPQTGRSVLIAHGLPIAPAGKAYQLWFIAGGQPVPGKVFKPDQAGNGILQDQMPRTLDASAFAVTLEPESGVTAPTGKMFLQ